MNLANDRADVRFRKDYDRIDISQGCKDFSALLLVHHGSPRALQLANTLVSIECYYKFSTKLLGRMKIADVPNVQYVEASVRQNDLFTVLAPFLHTPA